RLARMKCPTLIVWGKNDRLIPPAYADAFHRLIANSELVKLDDTRHMPMFEKHEEWSRTICEFLSKEVKAMKKLEFHYFHLMPWPYLPADYDEKYDSAWVTLPNAIYDPVKGHELYNRYFDEIERADKLGWDSVIVNEHHQNAYGTMPSPNLMAAVLTQRVKRAKIGIVGNALPLHDDPLRVAEEIAMLDVISGGRII